MGIRGLTSFLEDHHNEFFIDLKLRDTKMIIDGYALFYWLSFKSELELRYGGDYDSFTHVVEDFFESLFACNICPYVVLDGGCDISDKKFTTLKDRAQDRIQQAHSLSVGRNGCVCPLLTREVFIQVLIKMQVCFVQSFSEADQELMTLANHWNCPALSSDSDFCIFDLKAGFCPLNGFQWKNVTTIKGTQNYYIPATCFSIDAFCRHFNIRKDLLPLFAVLCGNDCVSLPNKETFLSKLHLPPGAASPKGRRHHRVLGLLYWLSQFASPAEALVNVLKYFPKDNQENVKELLSRSMGEYQQSQGKLQDFFQHGVNVCPDSLNLGLPEWVLVALAKGQLSPFISDALMLRRTFLHTQVENMQQPNAHRISQSIRQVIYGLLNAYPCLENMPVSVSEVERIHRNIKTSTVYAVKFPKEQSDLSKLTELSLDKREMLLLETLKVKRIILEPIPASLRLPIAVSCYWLQHPDVKATPHHVQALLLGMLVGPLQAIIHNPDMETMRKDAANNLCRKFYKLQAHIYLSRRLDLATAHVFCQWQSCLQMGVYLNQLLSTPLPEADLTCLYNGSLVHGLCCELPSTSVESLLRVCPEAKQLYDHLFSAVQSCAPPQFFLPKRRSNSKKKRKKKQHTSCSKNKVGTTFDTKYCYQGSNRFRLLMVENLEEHIDALELE
ncbi:PREDICTED: protein asteroid homolog 1 [Chrysochloris asiatica]|uniref:Protein asteroid homolog 1 n=1 Tax=Chrysochloris asiatica TaxID=185453 RepID=A0A9B0T6V6_CHRAS|nr:PREDICTED: protein asteroid homolog 1 [Chrysochloris asiatica]